MKKKIRFRMLQRILILLLCTVLVSGTCFDKCEMKVHATAVAVSPEAGAEVMMALWNLVIGSMVATGAGEFVANYDQEKPVFEKFMDVYRGFVGAPDWSGATATLSDGTVIDLMDVMDLVEDGTITLPNQQQWGKYRVGISDDTIAILGAFDRGIQGGGSEDPEDPGEPNPPVFDNIKAFMLSSGLVAALTATMSSLWKGEIEGVDPAWFENLGYAGRLETDIDGNYVTRIAIYYDDFKQLITKTSSYNIAGVSYVSSSGQNYLDFYYLDGESASHASLTYYNYRLVDGVYLYKSSGKISTYNPYDSYSANIPIFSTLAACENYLKTGDDTGCINKLGLDTTVLASNLPAIMAPKTDTQLSASALQSMYARMKAAYQTQVKPQLETETDTDTNIQTYTDAMTEAVQDTDPDTETDPDTDTDPDTETEPDAEIEPEPVVPEPDEDLDIQNYVVDLRQVFPFCIPFDLMALFGALDADPVAPRFEIPFVVPSLDIEETYVIDLSFLDEQMVLLRKLELVGFIIGLMLLTGKVIKW